jgi:hypothetical protein
MQLDINVERLPLNRVVLRATAPNSDLCIHLDREARRRPFGESVVRRSWANRVLGQMKGQDDLANTGTQIKR